MAAHWRIGPRIVLAALIATLVQALPVATRNAKLLRGELFDPDCYMHLQRTLRLMTEGGWHDALDPRINAPWGGAIHWTYVFDALLAGGASLLRLFGADARTALAVWGSAIGPLFLVLTLPLLAWGVKPLLSGGGYLWMVVLLFTHPLLLDAFLLGRPDHQCLLAAAFFAQLMWLFALHDETRGTRPSVAAVFGAVEGVALCTSVEALLAFALVTATLALSWCLWKRDALLRALLAYAWSSVVVVCLWLVWQRSGRFEAAYDRISIVHVVVLGAVAVALGAIAAVRGAPAIRARVGARLLLVAAAACGAGAVLGAAVPKFFRGPWPDLDPAVARWHDSIAEAQPLLPVNVHQAALFAGLCGTALLSLPAIVARLRRGEPVERGAMLATAVGLLMFFPLAVAHARYAFYVQALALLPWTWTTQRALSIRARLPLGKTALPLRTPALGALLVLPLLPAMIVRPTSESTDCPFSAATRALADPRGAPVGTIAMSEPWSGPEILWRTGLRVVAAPYEMAAPMRDTATFFHGSEAAARGVVEARGVDLVLVCVAPGRVPEFMENGAPSWLAPEPLPANLGGMRLYRVAGP